MINHGFINIYKEKGYTSHDVVAILRKLTGTKAGHTGTLDPHAEGVLPVCLGRATKLADYIMGQNKTYVAQVVLGVTTDTGDTTGEVLTRKEVHVSPEDFYKAVKMFEGEQWQLPPMYSAIKIGGKKLYELARKGKTVERTPRRITVEKIRVLGDFFVEINCSKGTYIRSLCFDIGESLGCGATMGELTRIRSGNFFLENAVKIGELKEAAQAGRLFEHIIPVETALPYPKVEINAAGLVMARNGNPLPPEMLSSCYDKFWLYSPKNDEPEGRLNSTKNGEPEGRLIGLYTLSSDGCRYRAEVML